MKSIEPTNIDEYIAGFPQSVQETLHKLRTIVREAAPEAVEALKYRMPTFVLHENLVHFAAFENHVGFYPTPSAIEAYKNELTGYKSAKGSVQFSHKQPVPFALIKEMVLFRVKEIQTKMAAKKKK